jgi:broad specificity phosphatase PhoE
MAESTTPIPPSTEAASVSDLGANSKTVFLIRHAHSMENQRIASMLSCFGDLGRFSLPKRSDIGASFELLNISANHDAPISEAGMGQCSIMKKMLQECNFVATHKIQLVAHSPLIRAKQTCAELLGCSSDQLVEDHAGKPEEEEVRFQPETSETTAAPGYPEPIQRVVSLNLLLEKTHMEWVPGNSGSFEKRVLDFQAWLGKQPESVVAVVGHSQFFKLLLNLPFKFDNVDVYQVQFDPKKTKPNEPVIIEHDGTADEVTLQPQWYGLELRHTCRQPMKPPKTPGKSREPPFSSTPSTVASVDANNLL